MKTIRINNSQEKQAFEVLQLAEAYLFGDNGGEPDGNAWLPMEPLLEDEIAEKKLGYYVNAEFYDVKNEPEDLQKAFEKRLWGGLSPKASAEERGSDTVEYEDCVEALQCVEDRIQGWAGYESNGIIVVQW